ncbi:hypothetical protein SteCoe_30844 [Stentor coeruleus]|uniref:Uncharacterized protein n=1 Tax=Stentor coeruleus TaxID=5963 RepID=A0A1R2B2N3_9CILI|nr:hypothetical protein SteCoe_30844 [Stentor coeruleus]
MSSNKKVQLIRAEGSWSQKQLSIYISANNKLLQVLNLLNLVQEKREIDVPVSSILEIRIKDSPRSELFGVNIPVSLLKNVHRSELFGVNIPVSLLKNVHQWVPLFPASKIETLKELPEEISYPRLLFRSFSEDARPGPEEINESYYETHADPFESFASEFALAALIESPGVDFEEITGRTDFKAKYIKQNTVLKILSRQVEASNDKTAQLYKKIESLENKVVKLNDQLNQNIKSARDRENYLLDILQNKDLEIQENLSQNMALNGKIRVLENEKEHHADKIRTFELEIDRLKDVEKELETSNNKLHKSELIQDQLNKALLKLSRNISDIENESYPYCQLSIKDEEIQMLKNITEEIKKSADMQIASLTIEVEELKRLLITSQEQERYLASKLLSIDTEKVSSEGKNYLVHIDKLFAETMKKMGQSAEYSKLKDFTYQVKGKAVSVALCRGGLFARVGSNLLNLETYIEDKCERSVSVYRTSRPGTSLSIRTDRSSENVTERSHMSKVSSHKTFLKSTQSSVNKIKAVPKCSPLRDRNRVRSLDKKPFR